MNKQPIALITAGASGIGRTLAEHFLSEGYRVHIGDIDSEAVDKFIRNHSGASASVVDVARVDQVDAMFEDISIRYGGLDVLVNNAGISGPVAAVEETEPSEWDRTLAVNLNGQFYCTRRAVPLLKKTGGGSIINIASNAAFFGCPQRAAYTASKWAIVGLTKTLAMELGPFGIRVNALCPCSVAGPRIEGVIERDAKTRGRSVDEIREIYQRQSSMRMFVKAEDVANMAVFLCSGKGSSISGQALGIDGHTESLANWLD